MIGQITYAYIPQCWNQKRFLELGGFVVVFLNYNKSSMIQKSVASALAQDYPLVEMFFMDDASTDNSGDVMEDLVRAYRGRHKVSVVRNTENQRICGQWNIVSKLATGNWYGMFCADDFANPNRVSVVAKITWNLGGQRAYEHFGMPFILTTTEIYRKIRNFNLSIVPQGSMLPVVVPKYVEKVILEPLHNCIAHQDYNMQERIVLTEYDDYVEMENAGTFFEGMPSDYIEGRKRPRFYRNRLLAEAMADLHMIDAMGYGIHDVYVAQRARYLPMPDYVTTGEHVVARVYGKVVNDAYSRLLIAKSDLPLADVMNLDRVQKHLPISKPAAAHLRRMHLIEGNGKLIRVTSSIAEMTDKKVEYIQFKATEDAHLKRMILDYIGQFGQATRRDIENLLIGKMHESLTDDEKMNKVGNLLTSLRSHGQIRNIGSRKKPIWIMFKA